MARTLEYSEVTPSTPMARKTRLDSCIAYNHCGKQVLYGLYHVSEGWQIAGSCLRWDSERWSVLFEDYTDCTTHGRSFKTLEEAKELFGKWTANPVRN